MAEYWSNLAMVTSAVVYLLALAAFAAEWAAARRLEPIEVPAGAGVLVGPGGLEEAESRPEASPADEKARLRTDMFGRMGLGLMMIGWASHLAGVVARGIAGDRFPGGNMYEFVTMALLLIVTCYLVLAFRGMRWLGLPVALLTVLGQGLAVTVFYVAVAPLVPALHSVWFVVHIVVAATAGAAFNVGGLLSILYLMKSRAERRESVRGYLAKLPSSARIDELAYRFHAFAFPLWTFAIAAGSVWA